MGLFSRKAAAPVPAPGTKAKSEPPSVPAAGTPGGSDDPLVPLLGMSVDQAAYADSTLTLTFRGAAGEAHLEGYGRVFLAEKGVPSIAGTPPFEALLGLLPGRKVVGAAMRVGDTLTIDLEGGLAAVASLRAGDYPGAEAVYLKGPGRSYVNFNENGVARLQM